MHFVRPLFLASLQVVVIRPLASRTAFLTEAELTTLLSSLDDDRDRSVGASAAGTGTVGGATATGAASAARE